MALYIFESRLPDRSVRFLPLIEFGIACLWIIFFFAGSINYAVQATNMSQFFSGVGQARASAAFGSIVTNLIPDNVLHLGTTILFFFFGLKILYEAYTFQDKKMLEDQEQVNKQIDEVESKIHHASIYHHDHPEKPLIPVELQNVENLEKDSASSQGKISLEINKIKSEPKISEEEGGSMMTKAVLFEAFSLIFFAEWGDRSQINTIALASQYNPFIVFVGGLLGHLACIVIAVIGGRYVAERLSEKTILYAAGILYLMLGVYSIFD